MNKKKILFIIGFFLLFQISEAENNTSINYYCDTFQNSTGIFCLPILNETIEKNNISNNISQKYNQAIIDLELIQNYNNPTTQQIIWSIKREAEILEYILKFIKIIYKIVV